MPGTNGNSARQLSPGAQRGMGRDQPQPPEVDFSTPGWTDANPRSARIARLQCAIAAGSYAVPAGAVAKKMVERLIQTSAERVSADSPPVRSDSNES